MSFYLAVKNTFSKVKETKEEARIDKLAKLCLGFVFFVSCRRLCLCVRIKSSGCGLSFNFTYDILAVLFGKAHKHTRIANMIYSIQGRLKDEDEEEEEKKNKKKRDLNKCIYVQPEVRSFFQTHISCLRSNAFNKNH